MQAYQFQNRTQCHRTQRRQTQRRARRVFYGATLAALSLAATSPVDAAIQTRDVEYRHGEVLLEGYLAYDDALDGKRPGVLVVHEWTGVGDYVKGRVQQLAALGYVAFAPDIYGKNVRPKAGAEAAAQAKIYRDNRPLMRERARQGLQVLLDQPNVDAARVAAIGYCFGGTVALELARSGAPLAGTVSFHGGLDTPDSRDARQIKGKVLVLHGAADPHVPDEQIARFRAEMEAANVDWQMNAYGGAVHSFTNPEAGNDPASGAAYNERADKRSWRAMRDFFAEIFANPTAQ